MRALVTGASGLVGAHVVRALERRGHGALAMVRRGSDLRGLHGTRAERVVADMFDTAALRAALEGVDVVVHCAAVFSYRQPQASLTRTNVDGTTAVLRAAAAAGVARVVVTSSSVTLGSRSRPEPVPESDAAAPADDEPAPDYFRSKLAQERAALALSGSLGLPVVLANPTIVLGGPDHRLSPSNSLLVRYLTDPLRTAFVGGCNVVSVRDVADGHVLLAERGTPGRRYVLGGENVTWTQLYAHVSRLCGTYGPGPAAGRVAGVLGAAAHEAIARLTERPPAATRAEARTIGRYYWYRHDRAAALGYTPRPADRTLAEALGWLLTSGHVPALARLALSPRPEVYAGRELLPGPVDSAGAAS